MQCPEHVSHRHGAGSTQCGWRAYAFAAVAILSSVNRSDTFSYCDTSVDTLCVRQRYHWIL